MMFMPSCLEVTKIVSSGEKGQFSPVKKLRVQMHLVMCGTCSSYVRQLRVIRTGSRQSAEAAVAPDLVASLTVKILKLLKVS